jgi:hypothetical protein
LVFEPNCVPLCVGKHWSAAQLKYQFGLTSIQSGSLFLGSFLYLDHHEEGRLKYNPKFPRSET